MLRKWSSAQLFKTLSAKSKDDDSSMRLGTAADLHLVIRVCEEIQRQSLDDADEDGRGGGNSGGVGCSVGSGNNGNSGDSGASGSRGDGGGTSSRRSMDVEGMGGGKGKMMSDCRMEETCSLCLKRFNGGKGKGKVKGGGKTGGGRRSTTKRSSTQSASMEGHRCDGCQRRFCESCATYATEVQTHGRDEGGGGGRGGEAVSIAEDTFDTTCCALCWGTSYLCEVLRAQQIDLRTVRNVLRTGMASPLAPAVWDECRNWSPVHIAAKANDIDTLQTLLSFHAVKYGWRCLPAAAFGRDDLCGASPLDLALRERPRPNSEAAHVRLTHTVKRQRWMK